MLFPVSTYRRDDRLRLGTKCTFAPTRMWHVNILAIASAASPLSTSLRPRKQEVCGVRRLWVSCRVGGMIGSFQRF